MISPSGFVTNENICIRVTDGGREDGEGQSVLGNTPYEGKGPKITSKRGRGNSNRNGISFYSHSDLRNVGVQEDQKKESHPYIIFINS